MEELKNVLADETKFNLVARAAFDAVDTDHSGAIDFSELRNCMNQISQDVGATPPTEEEVKSAMKDLDTDKSGKLEFNEFKVLVREVMEEMIKSD